MRAGGAARTGAIIAGAISGVAVGILLPIPIGAAIYAAHGSEHAAGTAGWIAVLWLVTIPASAVIGAFVCHRGIARRAAGDADPPLPSPPPPPLSADG
jgi:phosphate/sulfate permease